MGMTLEEFAGRLDDVQRDGTRYRARCPVHRGPKRSLVLEPGTKVPILVKCWARHCPLDAILAAVGCTRADLFDGNGRPPETVYVLRDPAGAVVAEHVRLERPNGDKRMFWRRNGTPGLKGLKLTSLPLYGADELATVAAGTLTVVTEGEKAKRAVSARGVVAAGTVTGAATIPCDAVLRQLLAYDVVLWPDNDPDGRSHMQKIARRLAAMGTTARVVEWAEAPAAGDAADFPGTDEELQALLAAAQPVVEEEETPAAPAPGTDPATLPAIPVTNRPLRDVTADALAALEAANVPPRTFARGGELVRWRRDEKHVPFIEPLSDAALRGRLARAADFGKRTAGRLRHVAPPLEVVRDLAALDTVIHAMPALDGITEIPPLRPDGSVRSDPGYDAETRLLYAPPPGFTVPPIAPVPTPRDVLAARALLAELLADFPFVEQGSRANAWAALLTPFVRPLISTCVPLGIFDRPRQGTGASLLAFAIVHLVTGRPVATLPAPDRDEEWAKLITSALIDGRTFVLLDNVVKPLHSAHLARAITTPVWEERLLGESRNVRVAQRAVWYVTGNNVRLGKDMPRRAYWIRLDAGLEYPEDRPVTTFRHPDLLDWIGRERPQLVAAVLTLARHWVADGRPQAAVPAFGSFENWAATVGSILAVVGIEGFLANRIPMREVLDDDEAAWREFLAAWSVAFGTDKLRVRNLLEAIRPVLDEHKEPRATPLRDALPEFVGDPDDRHLGTRLGTALRERRDRVSGDFRLRRSGEDRHSKAIWWQVLPREDAAEGAGCAEGCSVHRAERAYKDSTSSDDGRRDPPHPLHPPQREPGEDDGDDDDGECLG
jgi:hypothetical protein